MDEDLPRRGLSPDVSAKWHVEGQSQSSAGTRALSSGASKRRLSLRTLMQGPARTTTAGRNRMDGIHHEDEDQATANVAAEGLFCELADHREAESEDVPESSLDRRTFSRVSINRQSFQDAASYDRVSLKRLSKQSAASGPDSTADERSSFNQIGPSVQADALFDLQSEMVASSATSSRAVAQPMEPIEEVAGTRAVVAGCISLYRSLNAYGGLPDSSEVHNLEDQEQGLPYAMGGSSSSSCSAWPSGGSNSLGPDLTVRERAALRKMKAPDEDMPPPLLPSGEDEAMMYYLATSPHCDVAVANAKALPVYSDPGASGSFCSLAPRDLSYAASSPQDMSLHLWFEHSAAGPGNSASSNGYYQASPELMPSVPLAVSVTPDSADPTLAAPRPPMGRPTRPPGIRSGRKRTSTISPDGEQVSPEPLSPAFPEDAMATAARVDEGWTKGIDGACDHTLGSRPALSCGFAAQCSQPFQAPPYQAAAYNAPYHSGYLESATSTLSD